MTNYVGQLIEVENPRETIEVVGIIDDNAIEYRTIRKKTSFLVSSR